MAFSGSCHCGKVRYTVDEDPPAEAMTCNCSICRRKAPVHHFTTPDRFTLETPRDEISVYTFRSGNIRHMFCKTCGCAPFAEGVGPSGPMVEINLRCAEDVDLDALVLSQFDGASL
ncbi:GFA family protein [Sphingosinicella terrae]|uniref:GFA family protein n=1 Tax=Sphingosinicella terrae TaxID=2172047 RepID=UPI000E0DA3E4|nr:GFA family protein [Sphingosinicella terrae]